MMSAMEANDKELATFDMFFDFNDELHVDFDPTQTDYELNNDLNGPNVLLKSLLIIY